MTNTERIQANNAELRECIELAEGLPDAGGEVEVTLQEKTVTPATDAQVVTADSGYDALSKVTVNAMPTADQALPTVTVDNSGLILATAEQQAGYVVAGTRTGMKQLPTQAGKTVTPSTSAQTVVESGRYTTGAVMVAAIPDSYIQPSGSLDIDENGTYDVKNYASVNVNVAGGGGGGEDLLDDFLTNKVTAINSDITSVMAYGGYGRTALQTINLPKCTVINSNAFRGCSGLTYVDAPLVTSVATYGFYGCSKLTDINMPKLSTLGTYAFYKCDLRSVNFPSVTGIAQNAFYQNQNLERADFGKANKINQAAFANCTRLYTLILRLESGVCALGTATNTLQNTPLADGTGHVYVPKNLLEEYAQATNWSGYADLGIFRAIEDYPEICG